MLTFRVPLVLLLGAALHAAAPAAATTHVRVGATILRPLAFSLSSASELHVAPSLADGSTLLVSDASGSSTAQSLQIPKLRDAQLLPPSQSPVAKPDASPVVTVMLVYN